MSLACRPTCLIFLLPIRSIAIGLFRFGIYFLIRSIIISRFMSGIRCSVVRRTLLEYRLVGLGFGRNAVVSYGSMFHICQNMIPVLQTQICRYNTKAVGQSPTTTTSVPAPEARAPIPDPPSPSPSDTPPAFPPGPSTQQY